MALTAERGNTRRSTSPKASTVRPSASTAATAPMWRLSTTAPRSTPTRTGLLILNVAGAPLATIESRTDLYWHHHEPDRYATPAPPPQTPDAGLPSHLSVSHFRRRRRPRLSRRADSLERLGPHRGQPPAASRAASVRSHPGDV